MKRWGMGSLWFALLWLAAQVALGIVAGIQAGWSDAGAYEVGRQAGELVGKHESWLTLVSLALAVGGTLAGWLPGTAKRSGNGAGA